MPAALSVVLLVGQLSDLMIAATLESEHGNLVDLLKMINSETHSPHERNLLVLMEDQWLN